MNPVAPCPRLLPQTLCLCSGDTCQRTCSDCQPASPNATSRNATSTAAYRAPATLNYTLNYTLPPCPVCRDDPSQGPHCQEIAVSALCQCCWWSGAVSPPLIHLRQQTERWADGTPIACRGWGGARQAWTSTPAMPRARGAPTSRAWTSCRLRARPARSCQHSTSATCQPSSWVSTLVEAKQFVSSYLTGRLPRRRVVQAHLWLLQGATALLPTAALRRREATWLCGLLSAGKQAAVQQGVGDGGKLLCAELQEVLKGSSASAAVVICCLL